MRGFINFIVQLIRAGQRVYTQKWSFLVLFAVVFIGNVTILNQLDLLPTIVTRAEASTPYFAEATNGTPVVIVSTNLNKGTLTIPELPTKIEIKAIELSTIVANPTTTDITILDKELLSGVVRHPSSARLGEKGNVVLFGHSSYLPIVNNKAYKTFNGIQKLEVGDGVVVYSSNFAYEYKVRSVAKESADSNSAIFLSTDEKILTLVTCNSFGTKEDRFIVTADFVESHSIST